MSDKKYVNKLLPSDLAALNQQSDETLIEWYRKISHGHWPYKLPNPVKEVRTPGSRKDQILSWIADKIGEYKVRRLSMPYLSDEMFENYWRFDKYGDNDACEKYIAAFDAMIAEEKKSDVHGLDYLGRPRQFYINLAKQKEQQHGIDTLYSVGYYKSELLSSMKYINTHDETDFYTDYGEMIFDYEYFFDKDLVEIESAGNEIRFWFK